MTATQSLVLTAAVKGGKLDLNEFQRKRISDFLAALEGKRVTVKMEREKNTRSIRQNKLYWSRVIGVLAAETLNNPDDIHVFFRDTFLPPKFITLGSREVEVRKTTTDLTTAEFSTYLKQCAAWAASELGITLDVEV